MERTLRISTSSINIKGKKSSVFFQWTDFSASNFVCRASKQKKMRHSFESESLVHRSKFYSPNDCSKSAQLAKMTEAVAPFCLSHFFLNEISSTFWFGNFNVSYALVAPSIEHRKVLHNRVNVCFFIVGSITSLLCSASDWMCAIFLWAWYEVWKNLYRSFDNKISADFRSIFEW